MNSCPFKTLDLNLFFKEFLNYRDQIADYSMLGPWLKDQVTTSSFPDLNHIPLAETTYTRHSIAKEATPQNQGFEALVMRWDKQVKTSIHGHPAFSFYHVISGVFEMEIFACTDTEGLQLSETRCFSSRDTTWFLGQFGRFDNFIHRVTCIEPGFTFHIYSDDALKGISL